jgi:hypothetical protein
MFSPSGCVIVIVVIINIIIIVIIVVVVIVIIIIIVIIILLLLLLLLSLSFLLMLLSKLSYFLLTSQHTAKLWSVHVQAHAAGEAGHADFRNVSRAGTCLRHYATHGMPHVE